MDFLAIASIGFYPTPTPTNTERMAFVVTYGLFDGPLSFSEISKGLSQLGLSLVVT